MKLKLTALAAVMVLSTSGCDHAPRDFVCTQDDTITTHMVDVVFISSNKQVLNIKFKDEAWVRYVQRPGEMCAYMTPLEAENLRRTLQ